MSATLGPELEAPRPATGAGFSDAVTFAFGDPAADVYGLARCGVAEGAATGLAVLFAGGQTVAASAAGGVALAGEGWDGVAAGGVTSAVESPLERWRVTFDGGADGGFELEYVAVGAPVALEGGGMEGYEQLCRVRGTVRAGTRTVRVDCLGQRGHQWGAPDWDRMTLARTIGAWLSEDSAVLISALRPAKHADHGHDAISAVVLEGDPPTALEIAEPLLSTAYDADGRPRRTGWELWPQDEEAHARRGAGEMLCGASLDLGALRLDCAFFRCRMDGREGVGHYEALRRV